MTKPDHLRALARVCRGFGGQLARVSQRAFDLLFEDADPSDRADVCLSPFTFAHGIHWRKKIVYAVRGREEIGTIIHEMGHVFADPHHPEDLKANEYAWLGWEIALARRVGAYRTWSRHNSNYIVESPNRDWGELDTKERRAVVADRLAHAMKIGVVDPDGTPRSIR